jgi:ribonucleoside-triphosphate reductase
MSPEQLLHNKEVEPLRQKAEVYARCVGYIRPIDGWNPGKQEEFSDRKMFNVTD